VQQFDSLNVDEIEDKNKWQVAIPPIIPTSTPTIQDASMQTKGDEVIEVKDLKQNLKVVIKINKKLQCNLDRLEQIV